MNVLSFDAVTRNASVAVATDGVIASERTWIAGRNHAKELPPVIDECMASACIEWSNLHAVVVTTGPGSYTGIRIGLSLAKGIAMGTGCRTIGISSLEHQAFAYAGWSVPICAAIPLGTDRVAVGQFEGPRETWRRLSGDRPVDLDVNPGLPARALVCGPGKHLLAVDGAALSPDPEVHPTAALLISLAETRGLLDSATASDLAQNYLRLSTPEERLAEVR